MTGRVTVVFPVAEQSGGVERVAWRLLEHLGSRGAFVGRRIEPRPQGVAVVRVTSDRGGSLEAWRFRRDAAAHVDRARAQGSVVLSLGTECPPGDVYWVHSVHRAFLASSGPLTWRGLPVPRSARRVLPQHVSLLALERDYFTRHHPRLVLATSPREVEDLHRLYGVPPDICRVVPNGVDLAEFSPLRRQRERAQARAAAGVAPDAISLLFPANELHRKGFRSLVEAVARLRDPRIRIDVVGSVSASEALAMARRAGVGEQVAVHGRSSDMARWHAVADVLVLPTWYEPFGIVLVEGLASGLPVVTTALAGAAPAVEDAGGVVLDDPGDVETMAAALDALRDECHRAQAGRSGPEVAARYAWPVVLDEVTHRVEAVSSG